MNDLSLGRRRACAQSRMILKLSVANTFVHLLVPDTGIILVNGNERYSHSLWCTAQQMEYALQLRNRV